MLGQFLIIRRKIEKYIGNLFINPSDKILDVGSGNNPYYHKFMKGHIVRFDIRNFSKTNVVGDANLLPFKDNSFDKIIIVNSLYYCSNPFDVIKNIGRILKKDGTIVIITPFLYPIHDAPYDKYRFTEFGIMQLLKNSFIIKVINPIGGIFNLPAIFFHSLIKGIPLLFSKGMRRIASFFSIIIFYPFYILAQLFSMLDFLDSSRRWPTYYLTVAVRK
jgi:SAM-dependent methyltransferase|tara:strand:- start:22283 stop:22936 length:654 start_codon:yes stop_codon:yes gene_type:complete